MKVIFLKMWWLNGMKKPYYCRCWRCWTVLARKGAWRRRASVTYSSFAAVVVGVRAVVAITKCCCRSIGRKSIKWPIWHGDLAPALFPGPVRTRPTPGRWVEDLIKMNSNSIDMWSSELRLLACFCAKGYWEYYRGVSYFFPVFQSIIVCWTPCTVSSPSIYVGVVNIHFLNRTTTTTRTFSYKSSISIYRHCRL